VIKSATSRKNRTAQLITLRAQQLTEEHGLDGFTMDDLAAAADVSRRTLFNYFTGKADAVLGEWPGATDEEVAVFRAGGPAQDLVLDLRTLVLFTLDAEAAERSAVERFRRILRTNPRLLVTVHERYEVLSAEVVEHIIAREGAAFGEQRAHIAVKLLSALLGTAFDAFLEDPEDRLVAYHFDQSLRTARSLLGA
jgi:AcrR family transcriptional regulator